MEIAPSGKGGAGLAPQQFLALFFAGIAATAWSGFAFVATGNDRIANVVSIGKSAEIVSHVGEALGNDVNDQALDL